MIVLTIGYQRFIAPDAKTAGAVIDALNAMQNVSSDYTNGESVWYKSKAEIQLEVIDKKIYDTMKDYHDEYNAKHEPPEED